MEDDRTRTGLASGTFAAAAPGANRERELAWTRHLD
jgi:hypothetical protein